MKVALITPWENAWVPYFKRAIEERGHTFLKAPGVTHVDGIDVCIHGWTGQTAPVIGARNIMFLRRYELFDGGLTKVDWRHVDALICVNTWIAERAREFFRKNGITTPVHVIYNGTDLDRWKFRERKPNHKIGMACHVHPKKNLPLALQVLAALPEQYELHIAGAIQDHCTAEYLNTVGRNLRRKVYLYGHVESDLLSLWWEQMGFCLSTSISEGNPNNVIEAMAKGIKPLVHRWPGADDQFDGSMLFDTAEQAAAIIQNGEYDSAAYRDWVSENFSRKNIERVVDIALQPNQTREHAA